MTNTNIETRETFRARLAEWKERYAKLSQDIRMTKLAIKAAFREGENATAAKSQRKLAILREYAREAMEQRAEMKAESRAHYAARQAEKAAA